jgi:hypothetical protein
MTADNALRAALERIAPHLETLDPRDRESLRPAIAAVRDHAEIIHVPDRLVARIRDIDARLPKGA